MFKVAYGLLLGGFLSYLFLVAYTVLDRKILDELFIKPADTLQNMMLREAFRSNQELPFLRTNLYPEKTEQKGVVTFDQNLAWEGYTIFNQADEHKVRIIDMQGHEVGRWDVDPFRLWPEETSDILNKTPAYSMITLARNFSDRFDPGSVFAGIGGVIDHDFGLVKLDKNSNVLWNVRGALHHDIEQLDDGRVLVFLKTTRNMVHPVLPQITPPYLEEFLLFLDKDGHEIKRVSLFDAFDGSEYQELMQQVFRVPYDTEMKDGDILHPNTITYIPDRVVGSAPMLKSHSVLLSFRNIDVLAVLDLETYKITWASYGPWRGQHSPEFLDNGHVVMFDNNGNLGLGGSSRVIEVDLNDMSIVWSYAGTEDQPFDSHFNGMVQPLHNGNILVTETETGRIFEVTRDKKIVWDYYVESRYDFMGARRIPSVFNARRVQSDGFKLLYPTFNQE